jgi:hypothetical protein
MHDCPESLSAKTIEVKYFNAVTCCDFAKHIPCMDPIIKIKEWTKLTTTMFSLPFGSKIRLLVKRGATKHGSSGLATTNLIDIYKIYHTTWLPPKKQT